MSNLPCHSCKTFSPRSPPFLRNLHSSTIFYPRNLGRKYQRLQDQMYPPPPREVCSGDVCCIGDVCRLTNKRAKFTINPDKEWSGTSIIQKNPIPSNETTKYLYRKSRPEPTIYGNLDEEPRVFSPRLRRKFQVPPLVERPWNVPSLDPYYNS